MLRHYKETEGARGTRPHLEGTNYRAFARDLGGSVESVYGQGGQHGVVCGRAAVGEIVVSAAQVDRSSLRKCGGILDGNRHFVASHGASAQKSHSGYIRARTERARSGPGESVEVLQPGLAPNNVGSGRDCHRNEVNSRGREH